MCEKSVPGTTHIVARYSNIVRARLLERPGNGSTEKYANVYLNQMTGETRQNERASQQALCVCARRTEGAEGYLPRG